MKITEITVHASTSFNNPSESYANFKPGVSLTASIDEGESASACVKVLQRAAQDLVQAEKERILKGIALQSRINGLENDERALKGDIVKRQKILVSDEAAQAAMEEAKLWAITYSSIEALRVDWKQQLDDLEAHLKATQAELAKVTAELAAL